MVDNPFYPTSGADLSAFDPHVDRLGDDLALVDDIPLVKQLKRLRVWGVAFPPTATP